MSNFGSDTQVRVLTRKSALSRAVACVCWWHHTIVCVYKREESPKGWGAGPIRCFCASLSSAEVLITFPTSFRASPRKQHTSWSSISLRFARERRRSGGSRLSLPKFLELMTLTKVFSFSRVIVSFELTFFTKCDVFLFLFSDTESRWQKLGCVCMFSSGLIDVDYKWSNWNEDTEIVCMSSCGEGKLVNYKVNSGTFLFFFFAYSYLHVFACVWILIVFYERDISMFTCSFFSLMVWDGPLLNIIIRKNFSLSCETDLSLNSCAVFFFFISQWLKMNCRPESSRSSLIWNDLRSWPGRNHRTAVRTPSCEFLLLIHIQRRSVKRQPVRASSQEPDCSSSLHKAVIILMCYTVFLIIVTLNSDPLPFTCPVRSFVDAECGRLNSACRGLACNYRNTSFPHGGLQRWSDDEVSIGMRRGLMHGFVPCGN